MGGLLRWMAAVSKVVDCVWSVWCCMIAMLRFAGWFLIVLAA